MNNTYCIFSALYFPHMGGVEKYTCNLARELVALGNRVIIVTNNTEGAPSHETEGDIEVFRLPCSNVMGGRFPVTKRNAEFKQLWSQIEAQGANRVIVNTRFYPLSLLGVSFAKDAGLTPILIDHGSAHLTVGSPAADIAIQAVEHFMTSMVKRSQVRYFCVSEKSLKWIEHFGIHGEGVLNNSIDAHAFRSCASNRDFKSELDIPQDAFTVAFTGRLAPEKGVHHLAEAARLLDGGKVHFLVAGNGVLMDELAANAPGNLHLLGSLSTNDIAAMLAQCDAFCMPTRSEGFSTSLLEAASCELALITTDVGGVDELVPTCEFGRILKSPDPQAIVEAVLELESNRELARTLGRNARQRAEAEFTWKKTAIKTEEAFDRQI